MIAARGRQRAARRADPAPLQEEPSTAPEPTTVPGAVISATEHAARGSAEHPGESAWSQLFERYRELVEQAR